MPRQRGYEYPQVHRPAKPDLGLAPPQFPPESRFSWVDSPVDGLDSAERERSDVPDVPDVPDTVPQQPQSTIQPLPTVPDHLLAPTKQQQIDQSSYQAHPTIESYASNPSIPVQYQAQYASSAVPQTPVPHYTQQTGSTVPVKQQQTALEKPPTLPSNEPEKPRSDAQVQRPQHINIAPDQNPLSPHSPHITTPSSPNFRNNPPPQSMSFPLAPPPAAPQRASASTGTSWHHGLCSCADPAICVTGLFCPCVLYGRVQYRLNQKYQKQEATNMLGYSAINGACIGWAVLCGANILLTAAQRTRIRKRYEMDGSAGNICEDCVKSVCCCCCVLAQNEKEIQWREEGRRRQRPEGYVPPSGMSYVSNSVG